MIAPVERVFHIARSDDWETARRDGVYTVSSLGKQLDEEGFIHLSFARQVKQVADLIYRGLSDLVLLTIDVSKLTAPVVVEAVGEAAESFPHLYGPLNPDAVETVQAYPPRDDGSFAPVAPA